MVKKLIFSVFIEFVSIIAAFFNTGLALITQSFIPINAAFKRMDISLFNEDDHSVFSKKGG